MLFALQFSGIILHISPSSRVQGLGPLVMSPRSCVMGWVGGPPKGLQSAAVASASATCERIIVCDTSVPTNYIVNTSILPTDRTDLSQFFGGGALAPIFNYAQFGRQKTNFAKVCFTPGSHVLCFSSPRLRNPGVGGFRGSCKTEIK